MSILPRLVLAHGVLGIWDEVAMAALVVVAIGMLFMSWRQSQGLEFPDEQYDDQNDETELLRDE
ncbi:MAG: hypothetical protein MI924_36175 [Chloroflexales bacterium]|nr:hypothetical protein [Chloroflexales bacterium]